MVISIRDAQMNLLGTHDTERIITVLGAESASGRSNEYLSSKKMNEDEYKIAKQRLLMAYTILSTVPGIPTAEGGSSVILTGTLLTQRTRRNAEDGVPYSESYFPSTKDSISSLSMTPVWSSGSSFRPVRPAGMATPVIWDRRSIWSNSSPEVSPPMAERTAAGNL